MKKYINSHFILIALSLLIVWPVLLPGYFSHHDDLQVMRIYEMRKCFADLQIPCRWVPDMGYGNGFPLFNYYGPFPYYIGGIVSYLVGFVVAAKFLFFLSLVIAIYTMYLLSKEVFGELGGLVGAVLYIFAPYRALDVYVRGAIAESFALALIPLVFYLTLRLIKEKNIKYLAANSVILAFFLTSHTIMTLYFMPILLFWIVFWVTSLKNFNSYKRIIVSLLLGFGLATFYLGPAYFEKSLVQSDNLIRGDLNFRAHFVTLQQLFFNRNWGYGASVLGDQDTISFQIGWPHWWIGTSALFTVLIGLIKRRSSALLLILSFIVIACVSVLMTHNKSAFIWEQIEILKYSQFPWRFLSITIFCTALAGAGLISILKNTRVRYIVAAVIVVLTVVLNVGYFAPEKYYPEMNDQLKLSGQEWDLQSKAAIMDYLPKTAIEPREPALNKPAVRSGKAEIGDYTKGSNNWQFSTTVKEQSQIIVPVYVFPNWSVRVNGNIYEYSSDEILGRVLLGLSPGEYQINAKLIDTPMRSVSNSVTVVSFLLLLVIIKNERIKKNIL